ncbi:MAG: hypothetical protein IKI57_02060 [Clostridia bacterium]|nr:hypothetical protein [Clostridia bacterium]
MKKTIITIFVIVVSLLGYLQYNNSKIINELQNKVEYLEVKGSNTSNNSSVFLGASNNVSRVTDFKSIIIGDTVYRTKTGTKYHKEGCRYLKTSCTEITLDQAISMGLTPCKVCKP